MTEEPDSSSLTGAEILIKSLEHAGVETVFGIPGGAILPAYDPLMDSKKIRHILVRHEQGAGHAAEGYSYSSGKTGVCMVTSGPGATNLITPLANAYMDSVPIVAITGQVASKSIGTDAFQEADISGISMPVTKHNFLVTDPAEIPRAIAEAFHIAGTGRPGPVVVDIAKDAQQARAEFRWPDRLELPGYRPRTAPHSRQIREAASLILDARRPVFLIGGGIVRSRAAAQLLELVNLTGIPVVTTLMAKGAFPDSHPANLGMPGMHGTVPAVGALQRTDLIIALGTRFDDRVTGQLASFAPGATVIHADIDPAEIGKNVRVDVPIVGDAKAVITELIVALRALRESGREGDYEAWWASLDEWRRTFPPGYEEAPPGEIAPQDVISRIGKVAGPDAYYVTGVGQHQMWSSQFIKFERAGHWLTSGGLGTMGYCVPATMGAKVGAPDNVVWGIDGDGSFQMTNQELATCTINEIPVKIAIINNGTLGMVRQWQTLFYNQRYSNTDLNTHRFPDFVKLAEAYGCHGLRCEDPSQVDATIEQAMSLNDAPVVVDFQVHKDAMVWPMVPAGTSNDAITIARDLAPAWDREE